MSTYFPDIPLAQWQPTRDTLQTYARVLGKIRGALTPKQKHWWHVSLRTTATGLTTTAMPSGNFTLEIELNLLSHQVVVKTSRGQMWAQKLQGQSFAAYTADLLSALQQMGVEPAIDTTLFDDDAPRSYDATAVERYWQALSQIDITMKRFQGEMRQETSPVQIWPHHFDLAVLWISGNLIPGQDPNDEENADEQMNFGFSTGDESITDAYFYITAYPTPDGLTAQTLPDGAYWLTEGFTGAILPYAALTTAEDPHALLLDFWQTVQQKGATLLLGA